MNRHLSSIWIRIQEPRVLSVLAFTQYCVILTIGVLTLRSPVSAMRYEFGSTAMDLLSAFFILGGLIGVIATLPGAYWLERFAVTAVGGAAAVYLVAVCLVDQMPLGSRYLQLGFAILLILQQSVRWVIICHRPFREEEG